MLVANYYDTYVQLAALIAEGRFLFEREKIQKSSTEQFLLGPFRLAEGRVPIRIAQNTKMEYRTVPIGSISGWV